MGSETGEVEDTRATQWQHQMDHCQQGLKVVYGSKRSITESSELNSIGINPRIGISRGW